MLYGVAGCGVEIYDHLSIQRLVRRVEVVEIVEHLAAQGLRVVFTVDGTF